jgi:hypothetical protein
MIQLHTNKKTTSKEAHMLKRYQVIINEWLADALKETAKEHNLSFSEVLRLAACLYAGGLIKELHPEYPFPFDSKKIKEIMTKHTEGKISSKEIEKTLSEIYFETRKALEFSKTKKTDKKKSASNS